LNARTSRLALCWTNILFFAAAHLLAVVAVAYLAIVLCSPWTIGLAILWFVLCGLAITAGYHRHFAHPTHKAAWPLRAFYLLFGAASVQHSALKWSADHRVHHAETDDERDPYDARKGFWWSHIGWIFVKDEHALDFTAVPDLTADPLVGFQHRHLVFLALLAGCFLPAALGLLWGDPIGAVLCAGFLRLVFQWHATFSVNSLAHMLGTQPYSRRCSARDSWITALVTFGEGYHNYHHRFPGDYRNGVRWYHFDPTKWCIYVASKLKLTWDLRRIPTAAIEAARAQVAGRSAVPARELAEPDPALVK
jgi:stearoyl-CoA desaturase (Delta-9 desaturase)